MKKNNKNYFGEGFDFKTTAEIKIPEKLIDQVIGQEKAKEIIRQASKQRRHVLLIGKPGTGKSMLARALAELLPTEGLEDFLVYPNPKDPFNPIIVTVPAGEGKKIIEREYSKFLNQFFSGEGENRNQTLLLFLLIVLIFIISNALISFEKSEIMKAADRISLTIILAVILFSLAISMSAQRITQFSPYFAAKKNTPKLLIDNSNRKTAPFIDATGATDGALLGDVLHDPYQCLLPHVRVLTKFGNIPVSLIIDKIFSEKGIEEGEIEISLKDFLIGYKNGEICKIDVEKVYRRKYKGKAYKIKTKFYGIEFEVTEDHPVAVLKENESYSEIKILLNFNDKNLEKSYAISYVKAKDLKKGDLLLVLDSNGEDFVLSLDEVEEIFEFEYEGFIYNFTTSSRNYFANYVLVHNSGGLETPPHLRVVPGLIHKAHKGVLFIDEIATLKPDLQISLLTALQEKKFPISGRSPHSSGSMVHTTPAPCDFILVAAGTPETINMMHPALRSRIRGYGYEVYMEDMIEDNEENRRKFAQFVAQEVARDGKIPHFTKEAVIEVIKEARRMAGKKGYLTLRLRELGGLVRTAGDLALKKGKNIVEKEDVIEAKELILPLEVQMSKKMLKMYKDYGIIDISGEKIGRVNGLAVITTQEYSFGGGLVLSVYATVTPSSKKGSINVYATGNLQKIAREAVENVFAIVKKYKGEDKNFDVHIQFFPTYPGGIEGDSASISIATAILSSLEKVPVRQDVAMTGSLSINGDVLPVGGINEKILAAKEVGLKEVIIPEKNKGDLYLDEEDLEGLKIHYAKDLADVLEIALVDCEKKNEIIKKFKENLNYYV